MRSFYSPFLQSYPLHALKNLTHPLCIARLYYCYYPGTTYTLYHIWALIHVRRDENYENYNMEVMDVTDSERDINILENDYLTKKKWN